MLLPFFSAPSKVAYNAENKELKLYICVNFRANHARGFSRDDLVTQLNALKVLPFPWLNVVLPSACNANNIYLVLFCILLFYFILFLSFCFLQFCLNEILSFSISVRLSASLCYTCTLQLYLTSYSLDKLSLTSRFKSLLLNFRSHTSFHCIWMNLFASKLGYRYDSEAMSWL